MSLVHPQLQQSRSHSAQQQQQQTYRQTCEPHSYNIQAKLQKHVLSIFVHDTMTNLKWRQEFTQICFPGHKLYDVAKTLIAAIQQMINHSTVAPPKTHLFAKPITILVYNQWCYLTINGCSLPSFALRPIDDSHHADSATPPYGFSTAADTRGHHQQQPPPQQQQQHQQITPGASSSASAKPKRKKSKKSASRNSNSNTTMASDSNDGSKASKVSRPLIVINKGVVARNIARFSEQQQQQQQQAEAETQSRGTKKKGLAAAKVRKTKKKSRKNKTKNEDNKKPKSKPAKPQPQPQSTSAASTVASQPTDIESTTPTPMQREHDRPSTPIPAPETDFLSMLTSAIQPPSSFSLRPNHHAMRLPVVSSVISSESTLFSNTPSSVASPRVPITRRRPSSLHPQRKNSVPPSYVLQTSTPYFYGYGSNLNKHTVRCALAPSVESRFSASAATDHAFRHMMNGHGHGHDHNSRVNLSSCSGSSSSLQPYIPSPPVPKKAVSTTATAAHSAATSREVQITRSLSTQDGHAHAHAHTQHTSMQTLGTNTNTNHTNCASSNTSVATLLTSLKPFMSSCKPSMSSISSIPSIASISSIASLPSIPCEQPQRPPQQTQTHPQSGQFKKVSAISSIVPSTNTATFGSDGSDYYDDEMEMEDELLMSSDVDNLDDNASLYKESKHGSMDSIIDSVCTADGMGDDIVTGAGAVAKSMSQSPSSDVIRDEDLDEEEYKSESFECDFSGDDHYDIVRSLRRLRGYHDDDADEYEDEYLDDDDVLRMQRQTEGVKDGEYEYEYEYEHGYQHDFDGDDDGDDDDRVTNNENKPSNGQTKTPQLPALKTQTMKKNKRKKATPKGNPFKICLNGAVIGNVVDHVFEQQIAEEEYYDDEDFDEEPYYDPNYLGVNPYYDD